MKAKNVNKCKNKTIDKSKNNNLIFKIFGIIFLAIFLINLNLQTITAAGSNDIKINANVYNYDPNPVKPGEKFDLWIQLTNNSNYTLENITYKLNIKYPFILDDFTNVEKSISSLAPYQTKIIKYTLRIDELAKNDTYELEFVYTRKGTDSSNIDKYYIDVRSSEAIIDLVSNTSPKLSIGKESKINFKIKNLGSIKVKDIFITLNNSSDDVIKIQNLNTIYINSLDIQEEKDIEYSLIALNTAIKKSYTLPIIIKYSDSNSTNTISRDLGVQIIDNPNIVIGISQIGNNNTGKLIANTKEKIEVEIYNTGNVDAESVYVELIGDKVSTNFTKYFIGSIEKDNYDSALAEFNIKDITSGKYPLTINVYYKDSSLEEQVISKTIDLEIENKTKQNGFTSIISILFFIVIGIVAISVLVLVLRWMFLKIVKPAFCTIFHITQKVSDKTKKKN